MPQIDAATLTGWLDQLSSEHEAVGLSAAVCHRGELVEAATGVAHLATGARVTTDTVFQIGSISKVFTATMVIQLVEQGLVDLDAPAITYLPDLVLGDAVATTTITVRQLLTHTSGFEGDLFVDLGEDDECVARLVSACADIGQLHPPGERFSYCNTGYVILGRILEVLLKTPHDVILRERLCDPAGLEVVLTATEAIMRRSAVGHVAGNDGAVSVAPRWALPRSMAPAGSIICATAATLAGFGRLHLRAAAGNATEILGAGPARTMRNLEVELPDRTTIHSSGWGLGWILFDWGGRAVFGHDGGTIGQGSTLRISEEDDLVVAVVHNGGGGGRAADEIMRRVFERCAGVAVPRRPEPDPALELDHSRYIGRWSRLNVDLDIAVGEDGLQVSVRPYGPAAAWNPTVTAPLVAATPDILYAVVGAARLPLTFYGDDADGRPQWVHSGMRAQRRVATAQ